MSCPFADGLVRHPGDKEDIQVESAGKFLQIIFQKRQKVEIYSNISQNAYVYIHRAAL
jgi:hypothetical protein